MIGIGLRSNHYQEILDSKPDIDWFEVHIENYFFPGGKNLYYLDSISHHYPVSFHGVGLSLGSTDEINYQHLDKIRHLISRFSPIFVSEHLAWSSIGGRYFNDLLPIPYTEESFEHLVKKINFVQEYLGQQILIENISSYLEFTHSTIPEYEFINRLAKTTGCGVLLDLNNLYVNSINHDWNMNNYLANLTSQYIKEIHLAGFTKNKISRLPEGDLYASLMDFRRDAKRGRRQECTEKYMTAATEFCNKAENPLAKRILIDTHNRPISNEVWQLYQTVIKKIGEVPTLIEWDTEIPPLDILIKEAHQAKKIMEGI